MNTEPEEEGKALCDHSVAIPMAGMVVASPPSPKWRMTLGQGIVNDYAIYTQSAPSWFYRWMQSVCLGIHWERLREAEQEAGEQ